MISELFTVLKNYFSLSDDHFNIDDDADLGVSIESLFKTDYRIDIDLFNTSNIDLFESNLDEIDFSKIDFNNVKLRVIIKKIIKKIYDEEQINIDYVREILLDESYSYSKYCFYFFDQIIENKDMSSGLIPNLHDNYIFKLCDFKFNNLKRISLDQHAMCFYNFEYNNRNYLIFSNSGKGINNCQLDSNEFINNKLYYYEKDFDIQLFIIFIYKLSLNIFKLTHNVLDKGSLIGLIDDLTLIYPRNVMRDDLIADIYELETVYDSISFLYIILDYYAGKNIDKIYPCNFEHVLDGNSIEYTEYVINFNNLNNSKYTLKNFCDLWSKTDYKQISKLPNLQYFNQYVNSINKLIYSINLPSFHYNYSNKTINVDNSGLVYSYQQKSGSCNYYSVFNVLILMLFLKNFKNNDINNVILSLITLNYIFLLLLCLPYENKYYLEPSIRGTHPYNTNQIVFLNYIYNDLDFLNEIINFYPSNETVFNTDIPIDHYYNISINKIIKKNMTHNISKINVDINNLLDHQKKIYVFIHEIRSRKLILINSSIKKIIYDYFEYLYEYYKIIYGESDSQKDIKDYINGFKDIYIIYLCWLIKIYNEKGFIFIEFYDDFSKKQFNYGFPKTYMILTPVVYDKNFIENRFNDLSIINQYGSIDKFDLRKIYEYYLPINCNDILLHFTDDELSSFSYIYLNDRFACKQFFNEGYTFINEYLRLDKTDKLNYLNYIHYTDYSKQIDHNNFILNNNELIDNEIKIVFLDQKIKTYYNKLNQYIYFYNVHKYSNDEYKKLNKNSLNTIKDELIELTKKYVKQHIYYDNANDTILGIYILVLSNFKILAMNRSLDREQIFSFYFNYVSLLNKETIFIHHNIHSLCEKIENIILSNNNIEINILELFSDTINYKILKNKINKFKLIERTNRNPLFLRDDIKFELLYSKSIYIIKENDTENNYNLISALNRFGINLLDNHLMLIPTINSEKEELIIGINHPIYIFIADHDSYFKINFKEENDHLKIDYNNCFLYKNNESNKLILNTDFENVPFLKLFPPITPYLLYKINNQYYIDIILSEHNIINNKKKILFQTQFINDINSKKEESRLNYYIYLTFVLSDSLIMPVNNKFNVNYYNQLLNYYKIKDSNVFSLKFDKKDFFKNNFQYKNDFSFEKHIVLIKNFFLQLTKNISIDLNLNEELSKIFNKNNPTCHMDFDKILKQNRLCTYYSMNTICLTQKDKLIEDINTYIKQLLSKIYNKFKSPTELIIENINDFLYIRICNYIINILISINEDSKCWDIQQKFTYFDNILFLIYNLQKPNFFYNYEIIYLLSNAFIFNEEQFNIYRDILQKFRNNNNKLDIYHFLMGKGKSSFLTPILSMGILFMMKKNVTIITAEHLINDMREYVSFYEYISLKTIKIQTPTESKKHFLMINSYQLSNYIDEHLLEVERDNLRNTINIIDEFDLHYNYINSMFNLVVKSNIITEQLFTYICLYLYNNFENQTIEIFEQMIKNKISFISDVFPFHDINKLKQQNSDDLKAAIMKVEQQKIKQINIKKISLHNIINDTMKQLLIKKYNLDYGFDNIQNKANNLCIPYIRKSTPMTGSKFSDLLLTIIYTINFYKNNDYKLREQDYEFLDNNSFLYLKIFNIPFEEKYKIKNETNKDNLIYNLIRYLYYTNANDNLKYSEEQHNCSFQDIIYNKYNQLQVGYTGTAFIKLPDYEYPKDHRAFRKIIPDSDLNMELYLALSYYGKPNKINYHKLLEKLKDVLFNVKRSSGKIENNWFISTKYAYDSEIVDCENDDFEKQIHIDDIIKHNSDIFSISCKKNNNEIIELLKDTEFNIKVNGKISDGWKLSEKYNIDDSNIKCYKYTGHKFKEEKIVSIDEIIELNINLIINDKDITDFKCMNMYEIIDDEESISLVIDHISRAENIIKYIFDKDHTINRGIVDICGIFADIKNIDISKIILLHKQAHDCKTVYFDENHNAYEITDIKNEPSIYNNKPTNQHFYYYDQTHCVGKDLKTPQVGNVAIIVDNKTRITEFLQGIFRFRNLNKGTYLSFYICESVGENLSIKKISGKKIYKIINDNEISFQNNQEMGINLQFFKAQVRYKKNNYKEIPIKPLFIENIDNIKNYPKQYLDKLVHNLSEKDINRRLYNYFLHKDNISQFKSIILNTNSIETANDVQNQKQINNQVQTNFDISRIILINDVKLGFLFIHNNCSICAHFIGKPLFNNEYFKIDNKNIYVSNNLILKDNYPYINDLCFIVTDNLILIEKYSICQFYYYNKFPCYEFKTCKLLNIGISKKINLQFEKDINSQIFINLFDIEIIKSYNGSIEMLDYNFFCKNFNSEGINFLTIYYTKYLNKLYILNPIIFNYISSYYIINQSIQRCYFLLDNLKIHVSGETFDIDQEIIERSNFNLINDIYISLTGKIIEMNQPYIDQSKKYKNILTLHNNLKYDQQYTYQNYF
jgi:hypothetical protein